MEGTRWTRALAPLAAVVTDGFIEWLPRSSLPNRQGTHANTAFALARSWPWAQRLATHGEPALVEAIASASKRWYGNDRDYPVEWEPGGNDLSPALAEAELMGLLLAPDAFRLWVEIALPDLLGGRIGSLSRPVTGIDTTDGQAAHLHGLNLHRAACLRALQRRPGDSVVLERAAQAHLTPPCRWSAAATGWPSTGSRPTPCWRCGPEHPVPLVSTSSTTTNAPDDPSGAFMFRTQLSLSVSS